VPDTNGDYINRAEMTAHMRAVRAEIGALKDGTDGVKEDVKEIRDDLKAFREQTGNDMKAIRTELGAGPRWMGARANAVVDKVVPALIAIAGMWLLGERLSGG
jgi:hypothetical protein